MPKATTSINTFNNGEISSLALGRYDLSKYPNSVKTMDNFIINQIGGTFFRPGTRYIAETKDSGVARLMPFQYSADQDYVMEIGDEYMRFFSNDANAISMTSLDEYTKALLHLNGSDESTTIIDEEGHTFTAEGTAQLDTAQKVFGTASLLLDGDSDYVYAANSDDWNLSDDNFVIECRARWSTVQNSYLITHSGSAVGNKAGWRLSYQSNTLYFQYATAADTFAAAMSVSWTPSENTWYHIALVRSGASVYFFVNGSQVGATKNIGSTSIYHASTYLAIGTCPDDAGAYMAGWIDEVRISVGTDRGWTTTFTPATSEYVIIETLTELDSPYLEADVFDLHHTHKNDVKYLTHGDYFPRKLSRTDATTFSLSTVSFVRGPFLDTNITSTTITPSGDTGNGITLTASVAIFDETHVNSLWRIKSGVVKITAVTSGGLKTSATADVQAEPDGSAGDLDTGPGATTDWAEGAFSGYRGYPSTCAFHEGRLYYANTEYEPQKVWGSVLYAYDNFDEDDASDDDAVTFEIATEERNAIMWLSSGNKALTIGTTGGTFSAYGTDGTAIAPDNIQVSRDTNYGAASIEPKRISSFLYYAQRNLQKIRELSYYFDIDSQRSLDMTLLADHIIKDGGTIIQMDHQQSPNDRLWVVREDGELCVLTRNPEQEVLGWSRVVAGNDAVGAGKFESVVVIPKSEEDDQIWVIANRTINGSTKRFIEYFTAENLDEDWDAVRVDCSLTLDSPKTITGATSADPVVITSASHGFSNGDQVKINGIVGMTELNNLHFLVANKDDDTFELTDLDGNDIDGTAYTTYVSGGEVRKMVTAISGLSHLEGETVTVQVDGSIPTETETYTVSSGAITLSQKAAVVHAGLPYTGTLQLLKLSDGSPTGTGQTKTRRIYSTTLRVYRSLGLTIGRDTGNLDSLISYDFDDDDYPPDLYTGDYPEDRGKHFATAWARSDELLIVQNKPLPAHILAIIIESEVSE